MTRTTLRVNDDVATTSSPSLSDDPSPTLIQRRPLQAPALPEDVTMMLPGLAQQRL